MNKIILLNIVVLVLSGTLAAQGWQRRYGHPAETEQGKFVTRTPDGGYLLRTSAGKDPEFSSLLRLDADGDSIWAYTSGPFPTGGGQVFSGTDRALINTEEDVFTTFHDSLLKFHSGGGRLWAIPVDFFRLLGMHSDGVVLWKMTSAADSFLLRKYNFDGGLLWERRHPIPGSLEDVKMAPDGRVLTLSRANNTARLGTYSPEGEYLYQNTSLSGYYRKIAFDIVGNIVLFETFLAGLQEPNNAVFLKKLSPDGLHLWDVTYLISSDEAVTQIIPAANGDLILVGTTWYGPFYSPRLYRLDSSGKERWKKSFDLAHSTRLLDADANPDGSFSAAGFTTQEPGSAGNKDAVLWKINSEGILTSSLLYGRLVRDTNDDCSVQHSEPGLSGWLVRLGNSSCVTDAFGRYQLQADSGTWALHVTPPSDLWLTCPGVDSVSFNGLLLADRLDIPVYALAQCPQMEVYTGLPNIRRCFPNTIQVSWCNKGTAAEPETRILVVLPPELDFTQATRPVSAVNGDSLWFDIGFVDINDCGNLQLQVVADCDSTVLGQSLCVEARIFPDTFCRTPPDWSGARIEARAQCVGDSVVAFRLRNSGVAPTSGGLGYIIIEDQVVLMSAPLFLPPGGELLLQQPVQFGSLYRLEADQEPDHPGFSMPAVWVEGCGTPQNQGLALQYPPDDADVFVDITCRQVIGSYDPNDKSAHPVGYAADHFVEPGVALTYQIQFQNTGTDTAFSVVLRDTLTSLLDPLSMRPEASSHPYRWNLTEGHIVKFVFDDIRLPDSTTNPAGSQGYVQFRISPRPDLPTGTRVYNDAAIYFDFNEAIVTNETFHTIGRDYLLVSTEDPGTDKALLDVYPNPFRESATFRFPENHSGILHLYDLEGRLLRRESFQGNSLLFERRNLPAGIYVFEVLSAQGNHLAGGKILAQ